MSFEVEGDYNMVRGADAIDCLILCWLQEMPRRFQGHPLLEGLPKITLTRYGAVMDGVVLAACEEAAPLEECCEKVLDSPRRKDA